MVNVSERKLFFEYCGVCCYFDKANDGIYLLWLFIRLMETTVKDCIRFFSAIHGEEEHLKLFLENSMVYAPENI